MTLTRAPGCVARRGCDDVFATVKRESSVPLKGSDHSRAIRRAGKVGDDRCGSVHVEGSQLGRWRQLIWSDSVPPLSVMIRGRPNEKNPVLGRYLLCTTNKNAPGTIDHMRFDTAAIIR